MASFPPWNWNSNCSIKSDRSSLRRRRNPLHSSSLGIRLPLVRALCVLNFALTNLHPAFTFKTGCAQSQPLLPFLRSRFTSQSSTKGVHSTGMEGNATTVPSIVVYVTVPNKEAGKKLAESIVTEKLAACVNRVPDTASRECFQSDPLLKLYNSIPLGIESVYFWDGKIQTDSEELLIIKTRESLLEALTEHVKSNHEYDVPEVISMPITGGNLKYLEWIKNSTRE